MEAALDLVLLTLGPPHVDVFPKQLQLSTDPIG